MGRQILFRRLYLTKIWKNWNILGPYATYWGSTQELTETTEKAFNQKIVDYKKEK